VVFQVLARDGGCWGMKLVNRSHRNRQSLHFESNLRCGDAQMRLLTNLIQYKTLLVERSR